jgi:hypothetical protein
MQVTGLIGAFVLGGALAGALELRAQMLLKSGRLALGRLVTHAQSSLRPGSFFARHLPVYRAEVEYSEGINPQCVSTYLFHDEEFVLEGDAVMVVLPSPRAKLVPRMLVTQRARSQGEKHASPVATSPVAASYVTATAVASQLVVASAALSSSPPQSAVTPQPTDSSEHSKPTQVQGPDCCRTCGARLHLGDSHCDACGKELSMGERKALSTYVDRQRIARLQNYRTDRKINRQINRASTVIAWLSLLFLIAGIGFYFQQWVETKAALDHIGTLACDDSLTVGGKSMTVAEVRQQLKQGPLQVLIVYFSLAAIMFVLYFWALYAPLPALIVATAVFVMTHVVSYVLEPESLGQGVFLKVLVIVTLAVGIRAAIKQRDHRARLERA